MLVVADDATGALEAGAILAGLGHVADVELEAARVVPKEGAQVVLLPTRHDDAAAARARVTAAFATFGVYSSARTTRIYWKTDSTLRGPIGDSFAALRMLFPERPLVYVPAYPALGRTVREGVLRVDGLPVAETAFGRDPRTPVKDSRVAVAAGQRMGLRVRSLRDAAALATWLREWRSGTVDDDVAVCDAESEEQVSALMDVCGEAERTLGCRMIVAGPAGGIRAWTGGGMVAGGCRSAFSDVKRWLLLCGSRHPVSREQAEAACRLGLDVLTMPEDTVDDAQAELERLTARAAATDADGFVIFGGDTALALWRAMGLRSVRALGEVLPGVAVSRGAGVTFVTKAGGFGGRTLVQEILRMDAGAEGQV